MWRRTATPAWARPPITTGSSGYQHLQVPFARILWQSRCDYLNDTYMHTGIWCIYIYIYYVMIQCIWIPWKSMHSNPYCFAADIWRIVLFLVWGLICKYAPYTYLHTVNLHIHGRIAHHCKALINGPHGHLPKIITGSTGTWLEL